MGQLVTPLAVGFPDAPSGAFMAKLHGTETDAEIFSNYDLTAPSSLALNAIGRAIVYTRDLVDFTVIKSDGTPIASFTDGARAESLELQSQSFTGTAVSGSQEAGGAVDTKTALDRWKESAGTVDFKVRRTGQAADETLIAAFANVSASNSPFFNVKSYGAVGDGTTDDYAAFLAAYNAAVAAGGGIIFIPASANAYVLNTSFSVTNASVSMLGCGAAASVLRTGVTTGSAIVVNPGASEFTGQSLTGFSVTASAATAAAALQLVASPGIVLRGLKVSNLVSSSAGCIDCQTRTMFINCDIDHPSAFAAEGCIKLTSNAADSVIYACTMRNRRTGGQGCIRVFVPRISVDSCLLVLDDTGLGIAVAPIRVTAGGDNLHVTKCHFDVASTVQHTCIYLDTDVPVYESMNTFTGGSTNGGIIGVGANTYVSHIYSGSRINNAVVTTSLSYTPKERYDTHYMNIGDNATINATEGFYGFAGSGGRMIFIIQNTAGIAKNVTWTGGALGFNVNTSPITINAGDRVRVEFEYDPASTIWRAISAQGNFT